MLLKIESKPPLIRLSIIIVYEMMLRAYEPVIFVTFSPVLALHGQWRADDGMTALQFDF